MANTPYTVIQPSFTAGELAPALAARIDLEHYGVGLKTCRNFFVHAHGGVSNRPGTAFVAEVKDSSKATRLLPFQYNTEQTYIIEVGDGYLRFCKDGGQIVLPSTPAAWVTATGYVQGDHVSAGGVNYYCHSGHTSGAGTEPGVGVDWATVWHALEGDIVEIPAPWAEADLADIGYTQSADVMTLTHAGHPVQELTRSDHHVWTLTPFNIGSGITAPTGLAAVGYTNTTRYVVTAADLDSGEESVPSSAAAPSEAAQWLTGTGYVVDDYVYNAKRYYRCLQAHTSSATDAPPTGSDWNQYWSIAEDDDIALSWNAVAGADEYYIYKSDNGGTFGYIGSSPTNSFTDKNYAPVYEDAPPGAKTLFDAAGKYPEVVEYHQQRLCFAQSENQPQTIWMSQTGIYNNFNVSSPTKANDSISVTMAARQVNEIRHLISFSDLVVLTSGGEWIIKGDQDGVISPTSISIEPQSYRGAAKLKPIVSGNIVLYVQARGYFVRSLTYKLESDGYSGDDLSVRATHLFQGYQLVDWTYAQIPHSIVWAVRSDGSLLGLTYMLEQNVWGWHRHDTQGTFESIASVPEGGDDAVYFIVNRTIGGQTKRYIERLQSRQFAAIEDAWFVDCGLSYEGTAVGTVSGLDHLEGETVSVLGDGHAYTGLTVTAGSVTLPGGNTAAKWIVGLPYTCDLETLSPEIAVDKFLAQGRKKRVVAVTVRVEDTRGLWVGPDADKLTEFKPESPALYGDPYSLLTGDKRVALRGKWDRTGNLFIRQDRPLPATVLAVIPEIDVGGT